MDVFTEGWEGQNGIMMPKYLKRYHREEAEAIFFSFFLRLQRVEVAGKLCCCRRKYRLAALAGCMLGVERRALHIHIPGAFWLQHVTSAFRRGPTSSTQTPVCQDGAGEAGALWKEGMGPALRGCFLVLGYSSTHFKVSCQPQWKEHNFEKRETQVWVVVPFYSLTSASQLPS